MPASALALALAAAVVHALWNLLLAGSRDPQASTGAAMLLGCAVFSPVAVLLWDVSSAAWPYIAASAVLELIYFALLALAYAHGQMTLVYPLARGSAPVIVLAVSVAFLGASVSVAAVLGVLLVSVGVVLVRGAAIGGAWLALGVGAAIAAYTLVDNAGLAHAGPLPYLELVLVVPAVAYAGVLGRARVAPAIGWRTLLAGAGMFGAYALTLGALRLAAAAPVAAVRETSIVMATILGAVVLHETVGRARLAGAVVIVAGVAALALA
jgi:drug/metabolite transporter (DMT)-like permease